VTTTLEFLLELRRLGVDVWLEGGRVRCSAPVGVLDDARREELARRKDTIRELLEASAVPVHAGAIPVQPHGSRRPLFAVPGHNFIEAVRRVQPQGPYQIGGYCLGGLTAFEMARRLSAQGHEVSLLALFSTLAPTALTPYRWHKAAFEYWLSERANGARSFFAASGAERISRLRKKAARLFRGTRQLANDDPRAIRKRDLEEATVEAARRYQARTYSGRLTMFAPNRAAVRTADRPMDWRGYASDFEVCFGPDACNGDTLLREPGVKVVAQQLAARLEAGAAVKAPLHTGGG
jgi:thioesterase domain-containing protein